MKYINHSGGCPGADITWEIEGRKYGVETIAYSFHNHVQESKNPKMLTLDELKEGFEHVKIAARTIEVDVENMIYPYTKNLLSRNWFQVKNADAIYAIGTFINSYLVQGGTGWAVQMAIDNHKPVFFFDQISSQWYLYTRLTHRFEPWRNADSCIVRSDLREALSKDMIPILTYNFAGIGTRKIAENGIMAIKEILEYNLG